MISEERKELNRQRILEVTLELFTKQGVLTTTISQIAKASHVVDKTVLNIFGTKDGLVTEVMVRMGKAFTARIDELISTKEYLAMTGLQQIMFLQTERAKILQSDPKQLLLLNEVMVMVARSNSGQVSTRSYMDNLAYLYRVYDAALDRGELDGSIRPNLSRDNVLSMLVPIFRAALQKLAAVKLNPDFNQLVNAEKEVERYRESVFAALSAQK